MQIIREQLDIEESLEKRIKNILKFLNIKSKIERGNIISIINTNLAYIELHKLIINERKWIKETMCNLLITESTSIVSMTSHGYNYELPYLMDLPDNLHLLHLLQQGRFEELTNEKISRQLELFDIQFLKNVKLKDIREMTATGLVKGTVGDAIQKAEIGSKILQKVRR